MSDEKRTCGQCLHWEPWNKETARLYPDAHGSCRCPVPLTVLEQVEGCYCGAMQKDEDARECDCFEATKARVT